MWRRRYGFCHYQQRLHIRGTTLHYRTASRYCTGTSRLTASVNVTSATLLDAAVGNVWSRSISAVRRAARAFAGHLPHGTNMLATFRHRPRRRKEIFIVKDLLQHDLAAALSVDEALRLIYNEHRRVPTPSISAGMASHCRRDCTAAQDGDGRTKLFCPSKEIWIIAFRLQRRAVIDRMNTTGVLPRAAAMSARFKRASSAEAAMDFSDSRTLYD